MERRDVIKGMALAAGSAAALTAEQAAGQSPAQPAGIGVKDIAPIEPDFIVPDRFRGKTLIVTGCARGMGAAAAMRAAKEGANIVGVDWIPSQGAETIERIRAAGGKAVFVRSVRSFRPHPHAGGPLGHVLPIPYAPTPTSSTP